MWTPQPTPRRRTLRLRLTLLYGGLFLAAGIALLAIMYGLFASNAAFVVHTTNNGSETTVTGVGPKPTGPLGLDELGTPGSLPPKSSQVVQAFEQGAQQQHDAELQQLLVLSGIALLIMTVVSGGLGWMVAGRVLRPLRAMAGKAKQISEVNLHERLAVPGPDNELKDLGDTFDGLLSRLDTAFEAQKRFVANASHELRTPLTLQRTMIEVALSDPDADSESLRAVCQRVLAAGENQERVIEALLTLARSQRGLDRREPVDLAQVATTVVRDRDDASVRPELSTGPAPILGDARLVERLVGNLVDNAVRHNDDGGWAAVWTGTMNGVPTIQVANGGAVIPADRVGSLFQPFQRLEARTAGRDGHGLGLSIVAAIAGAHGAHLLAAANPNGGLTVTVAFPPALPDWRGGAGP
ncbi:MAG TPA: ATP-binding protein [Pseudonocardiaceae bacterium]|nr:ATP-binding protein [Pseudonocardiaceae bacterium]